MFTNNEYCTIETTYKLSELGMEIETSVPTIYEAVKFLRDKYHYHIYTTSISHESWQYHITQRKHFGEVGYGEDFYSSDEAIQYAIDKTIGFVKFEKND